MSHHLQTYFCEVGPCERCGRMIYRGSRVYTDHQGTHYCSVSCLVAAAWQRDERAGVAVSKFQQEGVR